MALSQALTADATPEDLAHVKDIVDKSGTSFGAGMKILARPRKEAMYAIYAFCREVDDIADEPGPLDERQQALNDWRRKIDQLYEGEATCAITRALVRPVKDYDLPREELLMVIDGMQMDLRNEMRAPSMTDLIAYCRRVAVAVGLLSIRAFGAKEKEADQIAYTLGEALQLTNILRDLADDATLKRLYLPKELLVKNGIESEDPDEVLVHPALPDVCKELAQIARQRYAETRALLAKCDRRPLKPSVLMMEVYERVLDELERREWQNVHERVSISWLQKLWIVVRHGIF